MNTKQLEYFIAVADNLNFTKAAEKFYISQTAMSLQIKALEETLKVELFNRNNRKVTLTPKGAIFYKEALHILDHINAAINDLSNVSSDSIGSLKLGFIKDFYPTNVSTYIENFNIKFPKVDISLVDGINETLYEQLYHGDLDLLFNIDFNYEDYSKFSYKTLNKEPLFLIVNKKHYLANEKEVSLANLKNLDIISLDRNLCPNGFDKMISDFLSLGFSPKISKHCSSIEMVLLMVELNMGITLFPKCISIPINNNLKFIPIKDSITSINSVLIWNKTNSNPNINLFLNNI